MTLSGSLSEVVGTLIERFERPLVTVPTEAAATATATAAADSGDVRAVLDTGVSSLSTRSRMRLAEPGVDVRKASVDSLVVSGNSRLAVVGATDTETLAVVDDGVDDPLDRLWATADPVTVDAPAYSQFVDAVGERLGPEAAAVVDGDLAVSSGGGVIDAETAARIDPPGLLVFGAARGRCLWSEVVDVARDTGLCSRGTLQRRLSTLRNEGVVCTVPVERDSRGGRPNRLEPVGSDERATTSTSDARNDLAPREASD